MLQLLISYLLKKTVSLEDTPNLSERSGHSLKPSDRSKGSTRSRHSSSTYPSSWKMEVNRPQDDSIRDSKGSLVEISNCTCLNRTPYDHNLNKPLRSDNSCQCTLKKKKPAPKAKKTKEVSVAQTQTVDGSSSETADLLFLMRGKNRLVSTSKTSQSSGRLLKLRNRVYSGEDIDQGRPFVCKPGCPGLRKFKNYGGYTPSDTDDELCSNVCDRPNEHLNKIDEISKPPPLKTKWGLKIPSNTEIEYYMYRSSREDNCTNPCANIISSRADNNRYSNDSIDFRRGDSPLRDISRRNSPQESPMGAPNFSENSFRNEAPDSRRPSTRYSEICDNPDCPWRVGNSTGQRQDIGNPLRGNRSSLQMNDFPSRRRTNDNYGEPPRQYRTNDDFDPNAEYRRRFQEGLARNREERDMHLNRQNLKYCANPKCPFNRGEWENGRMSQEYEGGRFRNQNDDRSRYQTYSNNTQRGADELNYCSNPECPFNRKANRRYQNVDDLTTNDGRNSRDVTWREENEMGRGSNANVLSQCICLNSSPNGEGSKSPERRQELGNIVLSQTLHLDLD